ncbi:MAG: Na+:solute symporter [Flavobacteriales bacterium]|nr:Na+:solute symporter [Flavobacteriales bacterium]
MILETIDWIIITAFLLLSLFIGLKYKNKASGNITDFFLGGRNLPWHIAGISMVATTFAADTPLAVTELVAKNGISANWVWWNFLIGGMLTTFFFANLWRRANVLTELELIELRYSGRAASLLRGFKSIYLGLFMNVLIIGWVNVAMVSILQVFFDIPESTAFWYMIIVMIIAMIYSSLSGLLGVAITDTVQFVIAITGCIILAVIIVNTKEIGGIEGLKSKLPDGALNFLPQIGNSESNTFATLTISIGAFFSFAAIQWWASWYPGAEPGGGGYIAQRMMSTKNEKDAVFATLFFQIAHYCLRPWPWIIVGLCSLILYPDLTDKKLGFVMAMKDYLPSGLKGLLFVAFLAAYMSTISTQLNWGASYLVNDLYKRFIRRNKNKDVQQEEKHLVNVSRYFTIIIMIVGAFVTTMIHSISAVWEFIMECGAGLGLVLILRWYWWRINAWSEITATLAPFVGYIIGHYILESTTGKWFTENRGSFIFTVLFTSVSWILVTFLTKPTKKEKLESFYLLVKPDGNWSPFKHLIQKKSSNLKNLTICWLSAITLTYSILFATGKIIFLEFVDAFYFGLSAIISFITLRYFLIRTNIFNN